MPLYGTCNCISTTDSEPGTNIVPVTIEAQAEQVVGNTIMVYVYAVCKLCGTVLDSTWSGMTEIFYREENGT